MNVETLRNRYVFTKDERCITLYKRSIIKDKESKNYGQDYDTFIGHYSNIQGIINKVVFLELADKGTINDLFAELNTIVPKVKALVNASV